MREMTSTDEAVRILYRSNSGTVERVDGAGALTNALADRDGVVWVELMVRTDGDAAILRDVFHFHELVDAIIDEYLPIVDAVDDTIDGLEEEVLHRPDTALMRRILIAKRNALRIRRAAVPQRDVMNRVARGEFPQLVHEGTNVYFRDIYDHLVRIDYLVDALRDLADSALNMYLSVVSNRLNEIMKVLTAVGAVFLPGALIAGIYGTNFPDKDVWPPYTSEWGFWVVVAAIIGVTLAVLAYMRYRRWI